MVKFISGGDIINTVYLILTENFAQKQMYSDIAKAFVKNIASEKLGIPPKDIIMEKEENGKPLLKNSPDFYFNISHTNGAVAIAFSDYQVGVDTEKIRNAPLRVANRYFNEYEKEYLYSDTKNQNRRFFEIWTKKEAYIKMHGATLSHLKKTDTRHIHTFQKGEYIISVCSKCDKSKLIVLENIDNV